MKTLGNERGIALVTAILLTALSLIIVFTVLYLVTQGITTSTAMKRYKNSLEASYGGAQFVAKDIIPQIFMGYSTSVIKGQYSGLMDFNFGVSNNCLRQKLSNPTANWTACTTGDPKSIDAKDTPDMMFTLKGIGPLGSNFKVYGKIVDSQPGNSDMSGFELLDSGSGVTGTSSGVAPKHMPGLYRIEVEGERAISAKERARLSVLYAY